MQTLGTRAIAEHLRTARAPATWSGCLKQAPPLAPQPRTVYCAWLRDDAGTVGLASLRPFVAPRADRAAFERCAAELGTLLVDPDRCQRLLPAHVAKPWGEEVWYSGIELRGESQLSDGRLSVPLGLACALFPDQFGAASGAAPLLLKRLCPHHEPIVGDLYFEVHARKSETYVVSHVDRRAWPDGVGEVRYGLADGTTPAVLRTALETLYAARTAADASLGRLPEKLTAEGWCAARTRLPAPLMDAESRAREQVDVLVGHRRLRIGDVLTVPPGIPHGLRHGVEVVELQTPEFERHILYANQPVVTQVGWDIQTGLALLEQPSAAAADTPTPTRLTLTADECVQAPADQPVICLLVSGQLQAGDLTLAAGEACRAPSTALRAREPSVCVLAPLS